jgi:hypothetical protein
MGQKEPAGAARLLRLLFLQRRAGLQNRRPGRRFTVAVTRLCCELFDFGHISLHLPLAVGQVPDKLDS